MNDTSQHPTLLNEQLKDRSRPSSQIFKPPTTKYRRPTQLHSKQIPNRLYEALPASSYRLAPDTPPCPSITLISPPTPTSLRLRDRTRSPQNLHLRPSNKNNLRRPNARNHRSDFRNRDRGRGHTCHVYNFYRSCCGSESCECRCGCGGDGCFACLLSGR